MVHVSDRPATEPGRAERDRAPAPAVDESRLAMMRRVKRMPVAERIALLDQLCREGTRIAATARRVR